MNLLDSLLSLLAPHECLGCGRQGNLLCLDCVSQLGALPPRCYRCRKVSAQARTCATCRRTSYLRHVVPATVYDGLAKEMVWQLKFAGARAVASEMAKHMIMGLPPLISAERLLIVPVPTATSRVRQRGYDQAKLLAREVARLRGAHYATCLSRLSQAHQVGANRQQRLRQLTGAFRVTKPNLVRQARIILIDDVITTGATLEAAAHCLRIAGAQQVDALVFAQP